ncbi:protein phosphatase 2C 80 [Phytophthora nicotianae]|uniref:Protein phosphatase n=1 Tax=Phytophthora nicotianae TaxID=4792 RepID=A0A0W8BVT7_PHYNI|nr:protein phosphatase 2C 80 [Phytophthora nicotianae]KUG01145.1 protein phosphatase 2C 80 [Phytophthora nicotianae]
MALRALGRRHDCMRSARRWLSAERKVRPALRLESGACGLPHPQKRATGGEDAWFISGNTVGVADGVGGWARKGIDSGEYSRTLMNSAKRTVTASDKTPTPLQVLTVAHRSAQPDKAEGGALRWQVVHETPNQCHYFNCPYQLGFGANGDKPEMGEVYDLETQEGDVIVLGTDGLFDNLFPKQIASLLDTVLPSTPELDHHSMEKVASCIAHTAHKAAKGTKSKTPFAVAAQQAGYEYLGGKMDDITVVTSLVTSDGT